MGYHDASYRNGKPLDSLARRPYMSSNGMKDKPKMSGGPPRITIGKMLGYGSASVGIGFFYAFSNFSLPLFYRSYTSNNAFIGLLVNTRSFASALVQPVVGAWSDRSWTRLGRRKPFFAFSFPLVAILLLWCAARPPFPVLIAVQLILTLLFNLGVDPYTALQSDIAPMEQRSTVNSVAALLQILGQLTLASASGLFLWALNTAYSFYLVAGGLVVFTAVTVFGVKEKKENIQLREKLALKDHIKLLGRYKEVQKFFLVQFILWFGVNAATPFLTLFISKEVKGVSPSLAQALAAILLASTAVFAVPVGIIADRTSRKKILSIGLMLFGLGALATGLFVKTLNLMIPFIVIIGIGNTAHTVLSYPLLSELVPNENVGEFWGLNSFFSSIGALVSSALAGWLADIFGTYRAVFVLTGVCMLAATLILQSVRTIGKDS
jgi:MFS family permease